MKYGGNLTTKEYIYCTHHTDYNTINKKNKCYFLKHDFLCTMSLFLF